MTSSYPSIYLVRHGETAWSLSGQHTGRTDIPLTPAGEAAARGLAGRLAGLKGLAVWSSPSSRALKTCELAGFGANRAIKDDLQEWDYGDYEGVTTKEIHRNRPDWHLFRHGAPNGESLADIGARADRVISEIRQHGDSLLIFSSSHFLRVLAARWLALPVERGASFVLDTASVSLLGYEHNLEEPVIRGWNETQR